MDLTSALQRLASYRAKQSRASADIVKDGELVLRKAGLTKLGDEEWAFLEQLALAALDTGKLDVADDITDGYAIQACLERLAAKFPESPRVDVLQGIRMEATESSETVIRYYNTLLEADESNIAAWKRKISVLKSSGDIKTAVQELSTLLDTFYTDVEGWLELGSIYSSCNQYTSALQCLSHAMILAPQNAFYILEAAETAYSAADIPLALKFYLRVVEMLDEPPTSGTTPSRPEGPTLRAWYGVKLCARDLLTSTPTASQSESQTTPPSEKHLRLLDELSTERILAAYSPSSSKAGEGPPLGRETVVKWLENTSSTS
ncbi:TPR-like protein [Sistotremastrum niveocremeum HHB9708]|uniref:ER membrane protein complex subunit 2 n=1 Tax=Sistotremastrum niveocremeum HHB9708 TaxID=1314777 RepID=A0A164RFX5_9AGAM|nr:TPR-like protein [Sistotremastrum niveocremeum HHB9708]